MLQDRLLRPIQLEPMEPRLLLSADLNYTFNALDVDDVGDALDGFEVTLRIADVGGTATIQLVNDETNSVITSAVLNQDINVNLTGGQLDDKLTIDLALPGGLNPGAHAITVTFNGIEETIPLLFDDSIEINPSSTTIYAPDDLLVTLTNGDEVIIDGDVNVGTAFEVTAQNGAKIEVLAGSDITAGNLGHVTLSSSLVDTVTGDADSLDFLQIHSAQVIVTDATITAGAISLTSLIDLDVTINTASAFSGSLSFSEVLPVLESTVKLDGADLDATGTDVLITATSDVTTTLTRKADSDDDTSTDAGLAVAIIVSSVDVEVLDGSSVIAVGDVTMTATNTINATTTADGTLGDSSSAGAMVAVTGIFGDTTVDIDHSTIDADSIALSAISDRTANTLAKAAAKGATNGSDSNKSEERLKDPDDSNGGAADDDQAKTGDGSSVDFAATVAVSIITGDTLATLNGATLLSDTTIVVSSSATYDISTIADGSFTSDTAPGVGVGVGVGVHTGQAKTSVEGSDQTSMDAPNGITLSSIIPASTLDVTAKSGASGGSSGLAAAGALAINITLLDSKAVIDADTNLNGSSLTLSATSTTDSTAHAEAGADAGDSSLGLGASVAINFAENETAATVGLNDSILSGQSLALTATSDHGMDTTAVGGSEGGTAITPVAALSFATYKTDARIFSDGANTLILTGGLNMQATHIDDVHTDASGKTSGANVAVGASFAMAVHTASANALLERWVDATGAVSLTGSNRAKTNTVANAAAKGSDDNGGGGVNGQADNQRESGDNAGKARGGTTTDGAGATPKANTSEDGDTGSSDDGISVAAAVAISIVDADSKATIAPSVHVLSDSTVSLLANSNVDTDTVASGEAAGGSVGVGAAVALNYVDIDNKAEIGDSALIDADGLSVQAIMRDLVAEPTDTHKSLVSAKSGAAGDDVGVAGSLTINLVDVDTTASIGNSVSLTFDAADVTLRATSHTTNNADSAPEGDDLPGGDVGVGASVAFQKIDTTTQATIGTGGSVSGTADDLTVEANGTHSVITNATHGAAGDTAAIGGSVAIALVTHETYARVESGAAFNSLTGDINVKATHSSTVTTATKADVESSSVGVGAGVGINLVSETVDAKLARTVNTSDGLANVTSSTTVNAVATGTASASGGDSGGDDADTQADKSVNDNENSGGGKTVPKAADSETAGDNKATAESGTGSSGGASGVGIAAAISVNAVTINATAATASGADITATGPVTIAADVSADAKAQTDATAVDFTNGDVNIGAAVSLNVVNLTQTATVGTGSSITGGSVTVRAETILDNRNDYSATAYAAGGNSSGSAAIAGTLALNVINYKVRAHTADGSSLNATGGNVRVSGEHDMGLLAAAVSASVSADGVAVGGSVAMNLINIGDLNGTGYESGTFASIGDSSVAGGATATATGAVEVVADTLVDTVQLDLPAKINAEIDDPDIHLTSLAIAAGGSGGNAGVAGSVSFNWLTVTTEALVDASSTVGGASMLVRADDEIKITSVAGAIGVGASGTGVGAGLDIVIINRFTNARVGAGATATLGNGSTGIEAESDETLLGVSANAGVGNSVGVAGSVGVHVINMATGAGTHAKVAGAITSGGDVRIDASGDYTDKMVAGSVGAGSNTGVGVANTTLIQTHTVDAGIATGGSVNVTGVGGDVVIEATSTESVLGITATFAAGGTAGVGGAVVVGVLNQNTDAYVDRGATINSSQGNVDVTADADTTLTSVAGNIGIGGSAGVGVGVDVGVINKMTRARLESNVSSTVAGNLRVVSTSSEDITSVVAGIAASGTAAVSVNPSIHALNVTTLAYIGDDPHPDFGPASSGAGNVNVTGSIEITADDATEIDKVSAGFAGGGSAGVGLAAGVTIVNKRTEAFIGAGAEVNARGLGAGVTSALGVIQAATASATQATVHADASASATYDGDAASVGASADVGTPSIGDGGGDESTDEAKAHAEVDRTTQLGAFNVKGIAISATNRDDVATFSGSIAIGGGAGVGVSGAVMVINANTRAYIDDNASVNDPNTLADSEQSVRIGAGNDFEHVGIVVGAGGGTVGVGVGVDVTVLNGTTEAFIDDGADVRAANDVTVDAYAAEDAVIVNVGVAGGLVGVGGTVGVLTINNNTSATIGANALVSAGGSVGVRADDQTEMVLVDGAVAGGFVGVGAGVGVLVIGKITNATIEGGAVVDAGGSGGGLGNTMTGVLSGATEDAADGFVRATVTGLVVQATSSEEVLHIVVAGGGGFVGVGGAVGVTVVDSDTKAEIGAAQINQNLLGSSQNVYVNAGNETRLRSIVGAIAGGFVGAAGAVDVGVVRNDTGAFIRSGANVRAGDEVEVNSLAIKELDGFTASAAGGAVGVSGAVSIWSLGTDIQSGYDSDGSGTVEQDEKPGETAGGVSAEEDAGNQSQKTLEGTRSAWKGYGGGADPDDPNNRSRTEAKSAILAADSRLTQSDMPSQSSITGKVGPAPSVGTQAIIEGGSTVRAGVSGGAVGGIAVNAKVDVEIDMFLGQFAVGAVGAGGAVGIVSVRENVEAVAAGTLAADGAIDVDAKLDADMNFLSVAGNGGAVALGASVVVLSETSVIRASIGDSAVIESAGSVTVDAITDRFVSSTNIGVSGGAVAVGASFSFVDIGGSVTARVGSNAQVGQTGTVGSLAVTATADDQGVAHATGLQGGAIAGQLNFATVNVSPTVLAEVGASAAIKTTGNATVDAVTTIDADATVVGVSIGGGALVASIATVNVLPNITAALRSNATLRSTSGAARVRAKHNETGGYIAKADTASGSGGVVASSGSGSTVNHSAVVLAKAEGGSQIIAGTDAELRAYSGAKAEADSGALTLGVGGVGVSLSDAEVGGSATAEFSGATMSGANVFVQVFSDLSADAETVATTGGLLGGVSVNPADALVNTSLTAKIGSGATVTATTNATINADADASATAKSSGVTVGGLGAFGVSTADATLDSTVTAEIGASNVSAGGALLVKASHNEGNSKRAKATSSASGGSLGASVTGADSDANSTADTYATVGGGGALLHGGGSVTIRTVNMNQAEAITDSLGIGGIAGLGAGSGTAITNGHSEAKVVDGTGTANNLKTRITGGNVTVNAQAIDRGRAVVNGAGGGLFVGGTFNSSSVYIAPTVIAEIGQYTSVNITGALSVIADSAAEGDAATEGTQVGGVAIGDSNSYVNLGNYPDDGDRIVVSATIDNNATVDAFSVDVEALFNSDTSLSNLQSVLGGTTNGESKATANSSGGGAVGVSSADAATNVRTNVDASINDDASVTSDNFIIVNSFSQARASVRASSFQGGLGAFGTGHGNVRVRQDVDTNIGADAVLAALGNINLTAAESSTTNTYGASAGGGAIAAGDADAISDIRSAANVNIGDDAEITSEANILMFASQFFEGSGYATAESYGAGADAYASIQFLVNSPVPGKATAGINVGEDATVYAKDELTVHANVDGGTINGHGFSQIIAAIGDADTDVITSLNTLARINIETGAELTGEDHVNILSRHQSVSQHSGDFEGNTGIRAFGYAIGAGDARFTYHLIQPTYIIAADGAAVASRDLLVRTLNSEPGYSLSMDEDGTNLLDWEEFHGNWTPDRQINWDADVILLSGAVPELVVESNGFISKAINVDVTDGGVVKGQGQTITNTEFQVNNIVNNDPGTARFEANVVSNVFAGVPFDDLGPFDGEADTHQTSQIYGDDGTWYARRTFDTVSLINHSAKKMIINNIDPIDRLGNPDGEVFINVNDRTPGGKEPFNFQIVNQFEPTYITIESTNFASIADIQFNGTIDNPIGDTTVTSNSDILSDGSQLIRTNTATFTAVGNIGSLTGNVGGGGARTGIRIDLVQSSGRPEDLNATAGGNIVLDLRGANRSFGGGVFTVNIGTLDAGNNVDVFMLNAVDESNPPTQVWSYALIIDENHNGGIDNNGVVDTPNPTPYIQFFRPDLGADPVFDFWKNLTAPLGVFGQSKAPVEATYQFDLVQAGRVTEGADIQLKGEETGVDINIDAVTNIFGSGSGLLYALTDGDIELEELSGDMRLGRVKSTEGDVTLIADVNGTFDIIDVESLDHLSTLNDATAEADVTGKNITFFALQGYIGEPCVDLVVVTPPDFIEIDSSFSGTGIVTATALNDIYLDEILGDMNLGLIKSIGADVDLHTRAGSITDGNAAANNIEARSIDLITVGGGVAPSGNDIEIDTDNATGNPAAGRLYVVATANGAGDASVYITETNEALDVLRVITDKGDIRLTVPDEADAGENFVLLPDGETLECTTVNDGRVQAERDITIRAGDNVELMHHTKNFILAGRNIDIFGDWGNLDANVGTIMNLRGEITSDYTSPLNAKQVGEKTRIFGDTDNDTFNYLQIKLGGDTYNYGSQFVNTGSAANDGEDFFFVDRLQDLTTTRGTYEDSEGNILPVRDALTLDGQDETDRYLIVTHGSLNGNGGLGGVSDYLINALDTGLSNDGVDELTIKGSDDADVFLLRGQSYLPGHDDTDNDPETSPNTSPVLKPAFVALLHGDLEDDIRSLGGDLTAQAADPTNPYHKVERINYDQAMNGRLIVYGYAGEDYFASDDNSVITTLDGGAGNDRFQIGQLYRSEREWGNVQDANDFSDGTVLTTRGYLSRGISAPMTIYGGTGHDSFSVYSNKAELRLEGNEGNDEFVIRAFALETGEGGDGQTLINGGDGDDNIQYNINAPVSIDGGPGFDRVVILGTEFSDNFVITEDGIYGAGLKVKLAGNEELREVDGLEGDDNYWVLGTPFDVATRIIGGLGSDDTNVMGDVTGIVISRDLEGWSSTIEHQVTANPATDPFYNNMLARGVDLNIASPTSGQIVIQEPDGRTVVSENSLLGSQTDFYEVFLSSAATAAVYVTVSAVRSPQEEQDGVPPGDTFLVSTDGVNFFRAITLTFNAGQFGSGFKQTVHVKAVDDTRPEGPRTAVISHSSISADPQFNFVAVRNVEVKIIDDDKAGIYLEESFAEYDNGTQVLEENGTDSVANGGITDTYSVRLAHAPTANVTVQLSFDAAEISLSTGDARYNVASKTITFTAANWHTPVVFTIAGLDDGLRENREIVPISHTVTASADTDYVNPATPNPDVAVEKLKVSVIDGNSEGVLVTQSFGSTLVVQDNPDGLPNPDDTYTLRLTKAPVGTVTITTIPLELPDKDGGMERTVITLPTSVTFDATDWWIPKVIGVDADLDFQPAPGTEFNKYFSKRPHTVSELFGPLEVLGGVGPEDRSLVEAILLPGETNAMDSDGDVVSFSGPFTPGSTNTMVVLTADLQAVADAVLDDDVTTLQDLVGFSVMITAGPGLDRFWLINAVTVNNGQTTLTLENPGRLEEHWITNGAPTSESEYAIVFMSHNFFVDETLMVDKLNVFNDTSVADDTGTVTATQISGLGMGPGVGFDTNEDNVADLFFASGISYATYTDSDPVTQQWFKDIEVLDLMLGRGNDNLTVNGTLQTTAVHGGLTVLHGGGNTPGSGGDTITVNTRKTNGILGSPLVVFGDTSADGYRYSGQSGVKSPNAMNFAFAGKDILDASASFDSVTMYGGGNDDLIVGSQVGDTLAGGSGNDRIFGQQGNDHIYGDSGINIDVNTRLLVSAMNGPTIVDEAYDEDNPLIEKTGHDKSQSYDASQTDDLTATAVDLTRPSWADTLNGGADLILGEQQNDIVFGDHGIITQFWAAAPVGTPQDVRVIGTGTGLFATANERLIESRSNTNGQGDTIFGNLGQDVLIGGAAGDWVDGTDDQDLIFGDNVSLNRTGHVGDATNPRFRVLTGTQIYSTSPLTAGESQVTGTWQTNPDGTPVWTDFRVELLDHSLADQTAGLNNFGNDIIAGGANQDQIFGELGNDTIQGDGAIGTFTATNNAQRLANSVSYFTNTAGRNADNELVVTVHAATAEQATDGDDYIEGNGGNDIIFGNLGQDDIVGGTSTMFGEETPAERPDGKDLIFGGGGVDLAINHAGDTGVNGHSRDSDTILGDNGDIHRLRGVNGALGVAGTTVQTAGAGNGFLKFTYDNYNAGTTIRIIPRATTLVDYTPGGPDYVPASVDIGDADEIHGESGDDFIYGMTKGDVIFGEGQDDDIVGGWGHDWISGGTGEDGVIGDDGRIFTSRNGLAEPLNALADAKPTNVLITTPGNIQSSILNPDGLLEKRVDLTPFNADPLGVEGEIQDILFRPENMDDLIFGGLGRDFLHGGSGDDGISGSEALVTSYIQDWNFDGADPVLEGVARSDYTRPYNPGDVLRFNPDDPDGWHYDRTGRAGEFALYDEYDPLRKIELNNDGTLNKNASGLEFALNFLANEAVETGTRTGTTQSNKVLVITNVDDVLFGDLGNDWLVGGAGRDNMYGGFGNDMLNADDNLQTHNELNDEATDTGVTSEDRAYGGGGRDILIGNTGGDRLIDWVGEFNSYLVPFAPFGQATVSRTLMPALSEYLYALSKADGADFTRVADTGAVDPARNGEPLGELGLTRPQDDQFHDQTGAPTDPQAGNIPGGPRDVLRSATFDQGQMQGFAVDSGIWNVSQNRLQVSATSPHTDAVAVYHVGDALPTYFEVKATINVVKPTAGWNANAYIIFDYISPTDFKFAGLDVSLNKIVMGHRDASGWIVDKQSPVAGSVKDNTDYNLLLAVNGTTAWLVINNNILFTHTYSARVIDGYSYGLNWGLVGVGSNNSRGQFDNIAVQVIPPQVTWQSTEDFSDGAADFFTGGATGTWTVGAGSYSGTPAANGLATNLLDIGPDNLQTSSMLNIAAKVTTASYAGFIFDAYSATDFKFVAIDQVNDKVIIGHYTTRSGWVTDASFSRQILSTTAYTLGVNLVGSTAAVSLDGQTLGSFAYNSVILDGKFGLFTRSGAGNFDDVVLKTNDPQAGNPMMAASSSLTADSVAALTAAELDAIVTAAISSWTQTLGPGDPRLQRLDDLQVAISDLAGETLGSLEGNLLTLDVDAAGYGWFIDRSPEESSEFALHLNDDVLTAAPGSDAFGRMDLLSVVTHELGHLLGFSHGDALSFTVMDADLEAGARYILNEQSNTTAAPAPDTQALDLSDWMFNDGRASGSAIRWNAATGDWDESDEQTRFAPFQRAKPRKGARL